MIVVDNRGNEFLDFIPVGETNAEEQYEPITHCLAVVKIEGDYLMGWNKWRQEWEIFGGCVNSFTAAMNFSAAVVGSFAYIKP